VKAKLHTPRSSTLDILADVILCSDVSVFLTKHPSPPILHKSGQHRFPTLLMAMKDPLITLLMIVLGRQKYSFFAWGVVSFFVVIETFSK
jgi:hypothetical protein